MTTSPASVRLAPTPLPFAACFVYSPAGRGAAGTQSRLLCHMLKKADERFVLLYARRVVALAATHTALQDFFSADDVLVPVPGSSSNRRRSLRVTGQLAAALCGLGLGQSVLPCLSRQQAVARSARAGRRPSVANHVASFRCTSAGLPASIVLVDDVVTKGRTLLAAAVSLHAVSPATRVRGFALLRTMGFEAIDQLLAPCRGIIDWHADDAQRIP